MVEFDGHLCVFPDGSGGVEGPEYRTVSASASFNDLPPALRAQIAVMTERQEQRGEFPEAEDDALLPAEWIARIAKHLGRAVTQDPETFRRELVIVGALALAGIESYDRRYA